MDDEDDDNFRCSTCDHTNMARCSTCRREFMCGVMSVACPVKGCAERVFENAEMDAMLDDPSRPTEPPRLKGEDPERERIMAEQMERLRARFPEAKNL